MILKHSPWESRVGELEVNSRKSSLKMHRTCAWCKKLMEKGDAGADTSHGMCQACAIDFLSHAGIKYGETV